MSKITFKSLDIKECIATLKETPDDIKASEKLFRIALRNGVAISMMEVLKRDMEKETSDKITQTLFEYEITLPTIRMKEILNEEIEIKKAVCLWTFFTEEELKYQKADLSFFSTGKFFKDVEYSPKVTALRDKHFTWDEEKQEYIQTSLMENKKEDKETNQVED